MVVIVRITGLNKTQKMVNSLVSNLNFYTLKEAEQWMRELRRAMIIRVPVDSGNLKAGIGQIEKIPNGRRITIQSDHLIYQEEGFAPHPVHSDQIKNSKKLTRPGFYFVKKNTPFIKPSLEQSLKTLKGHLNKSTKQAIQKAK